MALFRRKREIVTAAAPPVPAQFRAIGGDRRLLKATSAPWQSQARWFAQNVGLARFGAAVVAETISRMTPIAERRVGRDWVKGADRTVQDLIDAYVTHRQQQQSLLRLHAWHYQVTGEMYMAEVDNVPLNQFFIFMTETVNLKRKDGIAEIKLRPDASPKVGGLLELPANQLWRVWWADENWPLLATSPMRAVLEDLRRYMTLSTTVSRTARSALLEAGLLWSPDEAHVPLPPEVQQATGFYSELERDFYTAAELALQDEFTYEGRRTPETIGMYAPAMIRWSDQFKPPQRVELRRAQDPMNLEALDWCVKAYARGTNLPNQLVIEGQGQGNHWSAWLVDEKFHLSTTAPYADQVFHSDITEFYLRPTLRVLKALGEWQGDPENWRCGYDPAPVLVHPDRSVQAIQLYEIGLLKAEAVLRENGLSVGDIPNDEELNKIVETLQRLAPKAAVNGPGRPGEGAQTTPGRTPNTQSTVQQNAPSQQDARFALRASVRAIAVLALRDARRRAEIKVGTRARSRHRTELVPQRGAPITAALASEVGVTEDELLDRAFVEVTQMCTDLVRDGDRAAEFGRRLRIQALQDLLEPAEAAAPDDGVDWVVAAAVD